MPLPPRSNCRHPWATITPSRDGTDVGGLHTRRSPGALLVVRVNRRAIRDGTWIACNLLLLPGLPVAFNTHRFCLPARLATACTPTWRAAFPGMALPPPFWVHGQPEHLVHCGTGLGGTLPTALRAPRRTKPHAAFSSIGWAGHLDAVVGVHGSVHAIHYQTSATCTGWAGRARSRWRGPARLPSLQDSPLPRHRAPGGSPAPTIPVPAAVWLLDDIRVDGNLPQNAPAHFPLQTGCDFSLFLVGKPGVGATRGRRRTFFCRNDRDHSLLFPDSVSAVLPCRLSSWTGGRCTHF